MTGTQVHFGENGRRAPVPPPSASRCETQYSSRRLAKATTCCLSSILKRDVVCIVSFDSGRAMCLAVADDGFFR